MNIAEYLGLYWGEERLSDLLRHFAVPGTPKLKRGDSTCYLENHEKGIEFTFEDEAEVETAGRSYPDGALVLVNVRMYGKEVSPSFAAFADQLPNGLRFDMSFDDALAAVGAIQAGGKEKRRARWDFPDHCVFATFSKDDRLDTAVVQLPVAT